MLATTTLEKIVHANETPGVEGLISTTVEWDRGVMRMTGTGVLSPKQMQDHIAAFKTCVTAMHQRGISVIVIADLRARVSQRADAAQQSDADVTGFYKPGDRVAVIVTNSVEKVRLRQRLGGETHEFFLSESAAENWAFAYSARPWDARLAACQSSSI